MVLHGDIYRQIKIVTRPIYFDNKEVSGSHSLTSAGDTERSHSHAADRITSLGVSALFFINKALSLTSPLLVSLIRVTDIVVSYILQVLVFHDQPSVLANLGSSFVILSGSLLSIEQYIVNKYLLMSDISHYILRRKIYYILTLTFILIIFLVISTMFMAKVVVII